MGGRQRHKHKISHRKFPHAFTACAQAFHDVIVGGEALPRAFTRIELRGGGQREAAGVELSWRWYHTLHQCQWIHVITDSVIGFLRRLHARLRGRNKRGPSERIYLSNYRTA